VAVKSARTNVHAEQGDALLVEIAQAYYERNLTQQEVAAMLGISRSQISRYLQEARDRDIVQIRVVKPGARVGPLEAELRRHFPRLSDVIVASVFSDDTALRRRAVAREAAKLLERVVRPNTTLCFGAGRTLADTVSLLRPRRMNGVTVVQALGNAGHEGLLIDYNAVASTAAAAFGGRAVQINAPAILGSGMRAADLEAVNRQIRDAIAIARAADVFVVGLGSMSSDEIYVQTGLLSPEELAEAKRDGAVGDICGNFYDIDGQPRPGPFEERIVGIRLDDLRTAPLAIACASGGDKAATIVGALNGRYVNVLATDEATAADVLQFLDDQSSPSSDPAESERKGVETASLR
jgi:deoxyribonucleoside regulator